ncbi:MAG: hypothetical protein DRQ88_04625 [Epsilonproteobacteria bacterium]|nr:MAG: hypothetical protein DRQ89_07560 [Campylobacterota bacterium]RLA67041.1 MAG: hypothetical protein DRQ88_04625 [Campylobacterota bacterium]
MDPLVKTFEFFLFSLALGVGGFSILIDSKKIGGGFLRLVNHISFGALLIASFFFWGTKGAFDYRVAMFALILLSFLFVGRKHEDKKSTLMWALYLLQNLGMLAILFCFIQENSMTFPWYHYPFFISSALLVGIITFSMTLGHWYLVTPKLSERPLIISTYIIWSVLTFKVLLTILTFYLGFDSYQGDGYSFNILMLLMRVVWGYVIIGILSYFNYRLVKMRSIQSATGVLYVMTFFVFIGELISIYFYFKYGFYL